MPNNLSTRTGGWPNPSILRWARKQAVYELNEVAQKLDVSPAIIQAWEEGYEHPDVKIIRRLSSVYDVPFAYFFLESPPKETPLRDYRGVPEERRTKLSRETQLALREFRRLYRLARILQEITASSSSSDIGKSSPNEDPEEVAKREARRLGITRNLGTKQFTKEVAYNTRRKTLEALGIFVFSLRIPFLECRGAAIRDESFTAAILVNSGDALAARSFTLFHEYYHLMLKNGSELMVCDHFPEDAETLANRFAASILVPEDRFRNFLSTEKLHYYRDWWPDTILARVADEFAVSRDVIAIRLENFGLAPLGFYGKKRELWEKAPRPGGFGHEGKSKWLYAEEKLGHRFFDLALLAVQRKVLQPVDAAFYMGEVRTGKKPWVVKTKDIENWIAQRGRP